MESVKNSSFYQDAIQEINYSFGDFYLFDTYVIGEVNKDVVFTWEDHAKILVEELSELYDQNGQGLVYITNRINPYSVVPSDWLKFYKNRYLLKGYGIVSYNQKGMLNSLLEKLFMRNKLQSFSSLSEAISWAKSLSNKKDNAA
ncbi:hypothetical protein D1816_00785 [Aquimarina sp. AD10]|uniref:STAS/SEC14 domain-containing protein n=2 Tax=Flavobacteriaceae TaxID=49546 RepID=A0A163BP54_9FLAO|nr:hypothetical protein D1816_00785 [Aquimarina sp. AD10]KZS41610.1 hypothetical protein AWE51_19615 [Aquimarina aggregata]RKM99579.1 hypothetical protein D7033_10425 [Aquimarina sp. AD10]